MMVGSANWANAAGVAINARGSAQQTFVGGLRAWDA